MNDQPPLYHGIPRDQIDWFPTIDREKCLACLTCVRFCKTGVYVAEEGKPVVKAPDRCVVGCTGCDKICPAGAISHPPKAYLAGLLQERYRSDRNGDADGASPAAKQLTILWRRLVQEAETCPRCAATEGELEQAVTELTARLSPQKIEVVLKKKAITPEEFQTDPTRSNAILFNGSSLEELLKAKAGTSRCCGVCGDAACRTVETANASYEVIPAAMIVQAGMAAVERFDC